MPVRVSGALFDGGSLIVEAKEAKRDLQSKGKGKLNRAGPRADGRMDDDRSRWR